MTTARSLGVYLVAFGLFLVAVLGAPLAMRAPQVVPGVAAAVVMAASILALAVLLEAVGRQITGRPLGIFLSGRNTYSLSRLQMAIWTVVMLGGILAIAICKAWISARDALTMDIGGDVYAVMGISYATGAVVPGLLSLKAATPSTDDQRAGAADRSGDVVTGAGQRFERMPGMPALLSDLVKGDDLATAGTVDISKVQQLLITIGLVGFYIVLLIDRAMRLDFHGLPEFPSQFVNLLLVSHGGYLAYKAVPQTPATPPAASAPPARPASPDPVAK